VWGATVGDLKCFIRRAARIAAVSLREKKLFDLWASLGEPGLGVANTLAVAKLKRIGQRVCADLGLIVVDGNAGNYVRRGPRRRKRRRLSLR
jgi:hypothetical protein